MSTSLLERFPKDSQPYLIELADRLWAGHGSVMIGAGFSRNAIKNDYTKKGFPNWNELGDIFHKKLYGSSPGGDQHYLNVLKMADEVQAAFGRPVLDQLIIANLPDQDHSPSAVQIKLLELPWTDVFTTNYDTLLERASQNVINYKYNLVLNQADLIYAEKPRIIKLHGSLPSERPLIVSEEDYRRYPMDFAPFVNTVQQSLLENTFCLIGFSADDPNFLKWIGWIADNLGKGNSPKLYLIGILYLTDAQKKLLALRNITVVNLAEPDVDIDHADALTNFVDFLADQRKKDMNINWPGQHQRFSAHEDLNIEKVVAEWSRLRKAYPNWVIFPYSQVENLWEHTSHAILPADQIMALAEDLDIEYLFELNWRFERCMVPVSNDLQLPYEALLEKYQQNAVVREKWIELAFALWRFYREEGHLQKWQELSSKLVDLHFKAGEYIARYHFEKCLFNIALYQLKELKDTLTAWPVNNALPFWETKRAGLMAEMGQTNEAVIILENALSEVRKKSLGADSAGDYTWVSQEAYIMQMLTYVKKSQMITERTFGVQDEGKGFHDRQNQLKLYNCDPWLERDLFTLRLRAEPAEFQSQQVNYGFGLHAKSTTYHLSWNNSDLINGYQFLRYLEETGIPPHLPHLTYSSDNLTGALKRLATYSPFWTISALIRADSDDMVNKVLDREAIRKIAQPTITVLIEHLIFIMRQVHKAKETFEILNLSKRNSVIPLILGKLVVRSNAEQQKQLLGLLLEIYQADERNYFQGNKELLEGLVNSMSDRLKFELLPSYLQFPIYNQDDIRERLPDPFEYFQITDKSVVNNQVVVDASAIKSLLTLAAGDTIERRKAIHRLTHLQELDQLSAKDKTAFGTVLWSLTDPNGFPANTNFLNFSFMSLPHPVKINPAAIFKAYILNFTPPIQTGSNQQGISMIRGNIPVLDDLVNGTKKRWKTYGVRWTEEEALSIFNKLVVWWNADKHYLKVDDQHGIGHSIPNEFRARFRHLVAVLTQVLSLNKFWHEEPLRSQMKDLIFDICDQGLPCLGLKFAYTSIVYQGAEGIFLETEAGLASKDSSTVIDACNVIINMSHGVLSTDAEFLNLVTILTEQVKWRNYENMERIISTINYLFRDHPEIFNAGRLANLLFGLKFLLVETRNDSELLPINERLVIRKKVAGLAYMLYRYYQDKGETIPEILLKWENIGMSDTEFNEIKIEWGH